MKLLLKRKNENHASEHLDGSDLMSVRIKGHKNGFGAAEMFVSGEIRNAECLDVFKKSLHRFENMSSMKHYLDLGGVDYISSEAVIEMLSLIGRISESPTLFGIVDISAEAVKAVSALGAFDILQRAYLGDYRIHNLPTESAEFRLQHSM